MRNADHSANNTQRILKSWNANAKPWTDAVRNNEIPTRRLVTNKAIIDQVSKTGARTVWDVGAGEGWLSLQLQQRGLLCVATDAIQELTDAATAAGVEHTACISYRQIMEVEPALPFTPQLAVFNFSLFEDDLQVAALLQATARALTVPHSVIIQTLHPFTASPGTYHSQWMEGSWQGFSEAFTMPFPWYYRTMSNWHSLLTNAGFLLEELVEPIHPETGQPASLILQVRLRA